jgi:hypothetical protein
VLHDQGGEEWSVQRHLLDVFVKMLSDISVSFRTIPLGPESVQKAVLRGDSSTVLCARTEESGR